MHLVMDHLRGLGGIKEVANLRRVSKGWQKAFEEYRGEAQADLKEGGDMAQLCGLMPSMTDLSLFNVKHKQHNLDMSPVSACSQLTSVFASQSNTEWPPRFSEYFDVKFLPESVKELTLDELNTDPASIVKL